MIPFWKVIKRAFLQKILMIIFAVFLTFLAWQAKSWTEYFNHYLYDFLLAHQPIQTLPPSQVVIIGIDNASLDVFPEPIVFWHGYFAEVINAAKQAGAKALGIDLIQTYAAKKLVPKIDLAFSRSLRKADRAGMPVILGYRIATESFTPHLRFKLSATDMGYLNIKASADGAVRQQLLYTSNQKKEKKYSLAAQVVKLSTEGFNELPKKIFIDYRFAMPQVISLSQVIHLYQTQQIDKLKTIFKDKYVLIGSVTAKLPDKPVVPWARHQDHEGRIHGVFIHAYIIETLLNKNHLKQLSKIQTWVLGLMIALVSAYLFIQLSPMQAIIYQSIFTLIIMGISWFAFQFYWVLPFSLIFAALLIPALFSGSYKYATEFIQFNALKTHFKSYVNKEVMQEILANPGEIAISGKKVKCTIMFTDIRGFTTLSEDLTPEEVVTGLNAYFSEMSQAVKNYNGYLNRYLGDGILAIYGAPVELENYGALAAVQSGLEMLERLEQLNQQQIFPRIAKLQIGIGIHTGDVTVGNIGCKEKMDYSVIGDTVNLASRIESETKYHKSDLLISYNTYQLIKQQVEVKFVVETQVKGRVKPVKLYQVIAIKRQKT